MELTDLIAYARRVWKLREEHRWDQPAGFTVLADPDSRRWVALLMRQWDSETGSWQEYCELRCGSGPRPAADWIVPPRQMRGAKWVGIRFTPQTEPKAVYALLDRAMAELDPVLRTLPRAGQLPRPAKPIPIPGKAPADSPKAPSGPAELVLEPLPGMELPTLRLSPEARQEDAAAGKTAGQTETAGSKLRSLRDTIPEVLRELRRLWDYGRPTPERTALNFYKQGLKMQDYADTLPWSGSFVCYYPTYQDLSTRQLRGYFTWRAGVRRGDWQPIPLSVAYLYLYELINGIGTESPADSLARMQAFETGFLDAGWGDGGMRRNLRQWMLELTVVHNLPPETVRQYADPALLARDEALTALLEPKAASDEAIFAALCSLSGKKLEQSPVLAQDPERGRALFCACWRQAAAEYRRNGKKLFQLCFGARRSRVWHPFSNAIWYQAQVPEDGDCELSPVRRFRCRSGRWQSQCYEPDSFDRPLLRGFLHETERLLRLSWKAGRALKAQPEEAWARPYIEAAIEADRAARAEAARPRVEIDRSGLARIRAEAALTRDSLLVDDADEATGQGSGIRDQGSGIKDQGSGIKDQGSGIKDQGSGVKEQRSEDCRVGAQTSAPAAAAGPAPDDGLPLDEAQRGLLLALLRGEDLAPALARAGLTPALLADAVNEALYELFGDTVLLCENDTLSPVEDYREELTELLGGITDA